MFFAKNPAEENSDKGREIYRGYYETPTERNAMFKNHEFRVRIAKTRDDDQWYVTPPKSVTKDDVVNIADGVMKKAAIYVTSVIAIAAVAHAASEIVIHHGTKK